VPDPTLSPHEQAVANAQRETLFAALRTLTSEQRDVVELRLAGLTSAEIAAVLGTSVGAVKSCQFRAYARLRRHLTDAHAVGGPT